MCTLAQEIATLPWCSIDHISLTKKLRAHQTFLKGKLSKLVGRHSTYLELCMRHTLGSCSDEHPGISVDFTVFYDACETLSVSLENCEAKGKAKRKEKLHEAVNTHCDYVGHLICTRHQAYYYQYVLRNLKLGECVVVLD